jgi:hypothetical protein
MTGPHIELLPEGGTASSGASSAVEWPMKVTPGATGSTLTMRSDLDWYMTQFGNPAIAARDLLRIATAAYLADRAVRVPELRLSRALRLVVHVEQPDLWTATAQASMTDLLHWLTGDEWALRCVPAATQTVQAAAPPLAADDVSLLSGGLDSLCGALVRLAQPGSVFFLGHKDTATVVRHAQNGIAAHLKTLDGSPAYKQYALGAARSSEVQNRAPRTRSLLFMTMAVAAASGTGASRVLVPENGFTSVNPPLEPSRGGPLTTRSTHPWTFHSVQLLLRELGLDHIAVVNPHADETKGELLAAAMPDRSHADERLAAATVSCAKINAGRLKGGDANTQCGLCIACLVRRGAFAGARLDDRTRYLVDVLPASSRDKLRRQRRHDIAAWRQATTAGIPEHRILGSAMWPRGTDFDAVLDLCARGLKELKRVRV